MRNRPFAAPSMIARGKTVAAAAALAVGAVLLASCSSSASATPEDQITQVTQKFMDATNSGKVSAAPEFLCKSTVDALGPDLKDEPAPDAQMKLDKVEDIKIDGDNATAKVTVSQSGASDTDKPQEITMQYVNEDGWKACQ